jgi:hypothetical protein
MHAVSENWGNYHFKGVFFSLKNSRGNPYLGGVISKILGEIPEDLRFGA